MIKRILDLLVSVTLIPVAFVVCFVFAALYLIFEREWPIFSQTRMGFNENEFTIYKLRTMKASTRSVDTHKVEKTSITKMGKFLRSTKIDELPQLVNVISGDMSLVGPRPCLASQEELCAERRKLGVFSMIPGVTGLSQIKGIDMSRPVELSQSDAEYMAKRSIKMDLAILFATFTGAGFGDRVR